MLFWLKHHFWWRHGSVFLDRALWYEHLKQGPGFEHNRHGSLSQEVICWYRLEVTWHLRAMCSLLNVSANALVGSPVQTCRSTSSMKCHCGRRSQSNATRIVCYIARNICTAATAASLRPATSLTTRTVEMILVSSNSSAHFAPVVALSLIPRTALRSWVWLHVPFQ